MNNPQLEDEFMGLLSFQQFFGITLYQDLSYFTAIWRFNQSLRVHKLDVKLYDFIIQQLTQQPNSQLDTDTNSIKKDGFITMVIKAIIGMDENLT